mmetsp:Transcript_64456/g.171341  ORF Transcript_64456/g.171341 Transcript_64456/m.171341 type:complete len:86 (+) Transcript_64456:128-385(+)
MQNPGESAVQLAQATSAGSLWARICIRNKGLPLPMQPRVAPVSMEMVGNVKLTIWNTRWFWFDNILFLSPMMAMGFCVLAHKIPK